MLSNAVVALFLALGVAGWTYSKITQRTGGNTKSDITVVIVVGLLAFFVGLSVITAISNAVQN